MYLKRDNKKRVPCIYVLMMAALLFFGTVGMAYADSAPPYQLKINWIDPGYPYADQPSGAHGDGPWPLTLDHYDENGKEQTNLVFVNADGKIVLSLTGYDYSRGFSEGLAATQISTKKGEWGYLDKKGNVIIPFQYDEAGDFQNGVAPIKVNGVISYIDKQGNAVASPVDAASAPKLGVVSTIYDDGSWGKIAGNGNRYAYFDNEGRRLTPYIFAVTDGFRDSVATAAIGYGPHGIANEPVISAEQYNKFTYGVINEYGDILIPFVHDFVTHFHDETAFVCDYSTERIGPDKYEANRVGIVQLNDASTKDWHTRSVINVEFNGKYVLFDQDPIMENNTVLIPIRALFEAMGATVNWDQKTKEATVAKGNTHITLTVGKKTADVNGKEISMQTPAKMVGGRTLIPVRLVAESLGASVSWNAKEKTVVITSGSQETGR